MFTAFAAIAALIGVFMTVGNNMRANKETMLEQEKLQKESEDFTHSERLEQNEYEQAMHEYNLVNDPQLTKKGLMASGVSEAGAVQALVGSPSTGFTPTASNGSVGVPQAPNMNTNSNMFSGISDAVNSFFENELKQSEKKVNESTVEINAQYIEESNARIERLGVQNDMDRQQLELTKQLNASIIGKNEAERDLNIKRLDEINQNILESQARIENLDAQTINEYIKSSLLIAQTENIQADTILKNVQTANVQADTVLKGAQTNLVNEQVIGQDIANLDADIVLTFKKARLEASRILGADVDAPIVTQYLEMCAFGRYDSMSALISGKNVDSDGIAGLASRASSVVDVFGMSRREMFNDFFHGRNTNWKKYQPKGLFEPSMQPFWNIHNSGKSFRW